MVYSASSGFSPKCALGMLTNTGGNLLNPNAWSKTGTPVFQSSPGNSVHSPGHNGFLKSPDGNEDWMTDHATSTEVSGCGGSRTTHAREIIWNSDDTPNLEVPLPLSAASSLPSNDPGGVDNLPANANFEANSGDGAGSLPREGTRPAEAG